MFAVVRTITCCLMDCLAPVFLFLYFCCFSFVIFYFVVDCYYFDLVLSSMKIEEIKMDGCRTKAMSQNFFSQLFKLVKLSVKVEIAICKEIRPDTD